MEIESRASSKTSPYRSHSQAPSRWTVYVEIVQAALTGPGADTSRVSCKMSYLSIGRRVSVHRSERMGGANRRLPIKVCHPAHFT